MSIVFILAGIVWLLCGVWLAELKASQSAIERRDVLKIRGELWVVIGYLLIFSTVVTDKVDDVQIELRNQTEEVLYSMCGSEG